MASRSARAVDTGTGAGAAAAPLALEDEGLAGVTADAEEFVGAVDGEGEFAGAAVESGVDGLCVANVDALLVDEEEAPFDASVAVGLDWTDPTAGSRRARTSGCRAVGRLGCTIRSPARCA